jgi:hypothetical protein
MSSLREQIMTTKELSETPKKVKFNELKALGFIIFCFSPLPQPPALAPMALLFG